MNDEQMIQPRLNQSIDRIFRQGLAFAGKNPARALRMLYLLRHQRSAAIRRSRNSSETLVVPPFMIMSVTNSCNLNCKGCYSSHLERPMEKSLSPEKMSSLLDEASVLGISLALIAGGEPMTIPGLFSLLAGHKNIYFPVFTNGTMIRDDDISLLKKNPHILPVLSIEGDRHYTDSRRGRGLYEKVEKTAQKLKKKGVFFGISQTITRENLFSATETEHIDRFYKNGGRVFFFIDYVAFDCSTRQLSLGQKEMTYLEEKRLMFIEKYRGVFISFPGGEEKYGGCLSSGRGFFHINASGDLEPCPFSPYSDMNLYEYSLEEALKSRFLRTIRENKEMLAEHEGACALWENRNWVKEQLEKKATV